jgi:hypothetical protein
MTHGQNFLLQTDGQTKQKSHMNSTGIKILKHNYNRRLSAAFDSPAYSFNGENLIETNLHITNFA